MTPSVMTRFSFIVSLCRPGGHRSINDTFLVDSGHGGQTSGSDVDPEKGYDDGEIHIKSASPSLTRTIVIFPVDYQQAGHIVDTVGSVYIRFFFGF